MSGYAPKPIAPHDRLIFALDVATADEARAWIDRLGDSVSFYKIGMELLTSGDYFTVLGELEAIEQERLEAERRARAQGDVERANVERL